jgi:predicted SnoaL-like aldol condensation-catalyzing enzyme
MENRNAAIVRRAVERVWNRGELEMADGLFASAYVNHGGLIPDLVRGPEAIKISVALFRTAFPELHITIDRMVADGDSVELCWVAQTASETPVSGGDGGRHETLTGTTRGRFSHGLIVESWTTWDGEGALRRLSR